MTHQTPGDELSEEARRAAFREELRLTPENGGGRIVGRISKRFMWTAITVLAVLGLGGQLVEHYFGNVGLPTSTAPTTSFVAPTTLKTRTTTTVVSESAAAAAFIRLELIGTATASSFTLTDQHGRAYGTATARGKLTLITFFNKNCNDICPVLGAELEGMLRDLGAQSSQVNVIVVNTDPFSYGASVSPLALTQTGLIKHANVHFVTGPLSSLNAVWKAYGVEIKVGASASQVAHNSIIYFVSPTSQLLGYATPFAHESNQGVFSLGASDITRFAQDLKLEAISLNS